MSLMSSLPYTMTRMIVYVVSFPWTHIMWPCIYTAALVIQHSLVIPVLLIIRTFLYGLVYLPLVPVLLLLHIELDTSVPVEKTLYRLAYSAWPHLITLVGHLFHYIMVSVFLGTSVGIVAGINISIVSRIFRLAKNDVKHENTGDSRNSNNDYVHSSLFGRNHPLVSHEESKIRNDMMLGNSPRVFSKPVPEPVVKQEDLSASDTLVYEDDDGYNFMNLGPQSRSNAQYIPHPNSSLFSTTIIEESESENGQLPDVSRPSSSNRLQDCLQEEVLHETGTFSTGFNSAGSVFSPHVDTPYTGASESKDQQSLKSAGSVKLETSE